MKRIFDGTVPKDLLKGLEKLEIGERVHSNNIIKIGQNTGKSPGDLKTFAVTQTPNERRLANAGGKNS